MNLPEQIHFVTAVQYLQIEAHAINILSSNLSCTLPGAGPHDSNVDMAGGCYPSAPPEAAHRVTVYLAIAYRTISL
jgi:hypothetical protein